jgi:hypothetical protein
VTKAEAYVYNSSKWIKGESRVEDHNSLADTTCNLYFSTDGLHRLACYSSHGDSILWTRSKIENVLPHYIWEHPVNVEFTYDTDLKELV